MKERTQMIEWLRAEMVGPSRCLPEAVAREAVFDGNVFNDPVLRRDGQLVWRAPDGSLQEVVYFQSEPPKRKYGIGLLHPAATIPEDLAAAEAAEKEPEDGDVNGAGAAEDEDSSSETGSADDGGARSSDDSDDFEVTSPDVRRPSTIGVSFCVSLCPGGSVEIHLPQERRFAWQEHGDLPFLLNGRYESCKRCCNDDGNDREEYIWRRLPAVKPTTLVTIQQKDLAHGKVIQADVVLPESSPLSLRVDIFPRWRKKEKVWLLTAILRNTTKNYDPKSILFQSYFEVRVKGGKFERYPESQRPFAQLDEEEQSLAMLYSESATWGVGHGCAAAWDVEPGGHPDLLYADVMPAVQLPSMTPAIEDAEGKLIQLSMHELSGLSENGTGKAWDSLDGLAAEYKKWIAKKRAEVQAWQPDQPFKEVAGRHLNKCDKCLERIEAGIALLRKTPLVLRAFRLANLSMLLQQIATKNLKRRPLQWDGAGKRVRVSGDKQSPWDIYKAGGETGVGGWRAFQIAFLLMSLPGVAGADETDRSIVDLIWFPTGGGKTEAYLGVMSLYMFHERLLMKDGDELSRDGTNVLMRYTLRMLTTQQFQRAASLICAMEYLRRQFADSTTEKIPGRRFSLGLWIGREGSPNKNEDAKQRVKAFKDGKLPGNPLVLTECPWCRAEIGRLDMQNPMPAAGKKKGTGAWTDSEWKEQQTKGIKSVDQQGHLLLCPDPDCAFGEESPKTWLPVEVVDERIYKNPPSLVISTADKLAMVAYRPAAGALFGRFLDGETAKQVARPPGLIIQDELHLISGPLGTMYALYEGVFEHLCTCKVGEVEIKPKLIASTATIRGAAEQVTSLYARSETRLFPSPGLLMGDSFFGKYARDAADQRLTEGRLYLGIQASNYGSILTTQVRTFASALFRPYSMPTGDRDPWWTLLPFYNSIRELGGGRTLFESDIKSRLKFMFNREGFACDNRRRSPLIEELTSRRSQAEIVQMMDRLAVSYDPVANKSIDVCLASSIIEVGVDIDRLSLMGVVGQPKATASYIQVTGRVGRKWESRPGLILMIYNPGKSRDRSHFEQFHSYHRRLYERVEPTSATPFAVAAIQRGLAGAMIAYARQQCRADVDSWKSFENHVEKAFDLLSQRCRTTQTGGDDQTRSLAAMHLVFRDLVNKWQKSPEMWEAFPQDVKGHYLMLWPGQFATELQKKRGVSVPSSMRQVDGSGELRIIQGYNELLDDHH